MELKPEFWFSSQICTILLGFGPYSWDLGPKEDKALMMGQGGRTDILTYRRTDGWTVACTEITINNKIRTQQVVLIVGLSWASNDITFDLKKLHHAVRALP